MEINKHALLNKRIIFHSGKLQGSKIQNNLISVFKNFDFPNCMAGKGIVYIFQLCKSPLSPDRFLQINIPIFKIRNPHSIKPIDSVYDLPSA